MRSMAVTEANAFGHLNRSTFRLVVIRLFVDAVIKYGKKEQIPEKLTPPASVTNCTARHTTTTEIFINWDKVEDADGYILPNSTKRR